MGRLVLLFFMNVSYVSSEGGLRPDECFMGTEGTYCFWQ